ncbi:hypothetical protein L1987_14806 [Smallanthus sonchifolius]|uniref:Uncharacterized protein n=1 Tax=Smallanthus sonchifolius TaxID=185202 RepID=A0ACB9J6E7_9ASTR|nr:hypothetical protein L1987_14806 [Smallanthus sonchifolius]
MMRLLFFAFSLILYEDFVFTQSAKLNPDFCLYARILDFGLHSPNSTQEDLWKQAFSCFGDRGVNLRSAKVCELGLLSYKAKHGNEFDSRNYPFKKESVKAQGVVNWSCSNMGDPNGSIPTPQLVSKQKGGKYGVADVWRRCIGTCGETYLIYLPVFLCIFFFR